MRTSSLLINALAGFNRLVGTTATTGSPNTPAPGAPFMIFSPGNGWSRVRFGMSGADGAWAMAGLRHQRYFVAALDPTGTYDPAAKSNLTPEPTPPDPTEHQP